MSYWKCAKTEIKNDGRSVEMSFVDDLGIARSTSELTAEDWQNIWAYKAAYEEPERRIIELHRALTRAMMAEFDAKIAKEKEGAI